MKNTRGVQLFFWTLISVYFLFLFYQILYSDYLFSDEAYFLWFQADHHTVFGFWNPQGRALTGWWEQFLFERAGTIAHLKYVRLVSWGGWVLCVVLLFYVLKRLQRVEGIVLGDWAIYLTTAFMASSLFANVIIGWAACVEIFIPVLLSLAAGMLLFERVQKAEASSVGKDGRVWRIFFWVGLLFILLGVLALFVYQTDYPFVLLPFYCLFLSRKDGRFTRQMRIGVLFFFLCLGVYYGLFRYSLYHMQVAESWRTEVQYDLGDRLSFFFSYPMNQAFNFSYFFDTHSGWSQAIFPVLFAGWVLYVFFSPPREKGNRLLYLAGMIAWWVLGYLPQLVAKENFGGYRSMPVLSVMVFLMAADLLQSLVRQGRGRQVLGFALVLLMLGWGGYVYYAYRSYPLREEYWVVRQEIQDHYNSRIKEVVVIQALEDGFARNFRVMHFKDEFGMPSLYKGWVAEPLVKQIVYELTGSRQEAQGLTVVVFEKREAMTDTLLLSDPRVLVLDVQPLIDAKARDRGLSY